MPIACAASGLRRTISRPGEARGVGLPEILFASVRNGKTERERVDRADAEQRKDQPLRGGQR